MTYTHATPWMLDVLRLDDTKKRRYCDLDDTVPLTALGEDYANAHGLVDIPDAVWDAAFDAAEQLDALPPVSKW